MSKKKVSSALSLQKAEKHLLQELPFVEAIVFVALRKWLSEHPEYKFVRMYAERKDVLYFTFKKMSVTKKKDALGVVRRVVYASDFLNVGVIVEEREPNVGSVSQIGKKLVVKHYTETGEKE